MKSTKDQILEFLDKCDEFTKCKFIMATTKIKDLLKCIVNSPELYKLFDTVTKDFNYVEQKPMCLIRDSHNSGKVILPQTVGQRLAFIFCLLVEFDRDSLNFNEFLEAYFREDGSYFESYRAFCNTIIVNLENLIKQVFKDQIGDIELERRKDDGANTEKAKLISSIALSVEAEKQFISTSAPKEERESAVKMLDALVKAVKSEDEEMIDAVICGYNYFILYNRCVSDEVASLIEFISEYEKLL